MKRVKSRLLSGLLSMSMVFSVIAVPVKALAATDTSGHWAEASINQWINNGYISGYPDGTFRPNNAISRAEFVTIANKAFGFTSSQGISFGDVRPGYWAYSEIQKGVAAGYIQGDSEGTFRPGSAVSRQEAAVMLARLKGYDSDEAGAYNYSDRWAMANWAVGSVGAVSRNGVMSGYPDGTFRPQQSLTRAEAVASLQKIANNSNSFGNTSSSSSSSSSSNSGNTQSSIITNTGSSSINTSTNSSSSSSSTSNEYGFDGTVLEGTRLEGRTLTKDLLIPRSVGSQNVTLKNIRMKGTLYVEGGNNITLENCKIGTVVMNKAGAVLKNNGSSDVDEVRFEERGRIDGKGYMNVVIDDDDVSEVIIDADVDTLTLDADVDVRLYANANISTFEVTKNADTAKIKVGEDAEITEMEIYDKVRISGKGKIDTMTVYVSGVRSEIEPKRLIQQDNARKPNFGYKDDDDDDDDDYDNLTLDDDDEKFDGDGERYDRVRIAAEDVTVEDLIASDLTITSAAGDSTIRLEDVTVRGNVYIEGGGDSSVIFDDCTINGNIYSRKSTSGRYDEAVAIKLRNTTFKGDVYVTGDTILESDEKLRKVILNRALSRPFRMEADAEEVIINYNNDVQFRTSSTINNVEVASGLTDVKITMSGGKIATLTTRSPIVLDGSGTVDKLLTSQTNDIGSGITIGSTDTIQGGTTGSYTILSSVTGGNGVISPVGKETVASGASKTYNITANTNYHIAAIVVDNAEVNLDGKLYQDCTFTFHGVNANHDIIVSFAEGAGTDGSGSASLGTANGDGSNDPSEEGDYTITVNVNGTGGSADNMLLPVKDSEDATVTFTANPNYHIAKIVIDEGTDAEQNLRRISDSDITFKKVTYTFKNVTRSHTITVTFEDGEGTNEIGISSEDPDDPTIKPSGYKYDMEIELFNALTGDILTRNDDGRYYCIAGDTVRLNLMDFETDDPNKEYLETKWAVVNSTTGIEMNLMQREGQTAATLQTTSGSGYAAVLKVQVYDTSKTSTMPIASSDVAELHVDVPLEKLELNSLNCQGNQFSLSPQNLIYAPSTASAANDTQNITWKVTSVDIDPVSAPLIAVDDPATTARIVDISDGKNGTVPSLRVEQYYKETDSSEAKDLLLEPKGTVKILATIPNGIGNMQPYTREFTINFIGNQVIPVDRVEINATDKGTAKEQFGISQLDLSKITTTVIPRDATYKSVEWEIDKQLTLDGTANADKTLATVENQKVSGNDRKTLLQTTGYPGKVILKPFVKNGKGSEDFVSPDGSQERITVNIYTVEPEVEANKIVSNNGTDAGDIITLSAKVKNADKTPYTEILGWQKRYEGETNWTPITEGNGKGQLVFESNPKDGVYTAKYVIDDGDLNDDNYAPKKVYFRAYTEYDAVDNTTVTPTKVYSGEVNVECHAQEIKLPTKTKLGEQRIDVTDINVNQKTCTIKGYDTIELPATLANETPITWSISPEDDDIAQLDTSKNILTLKGKPNEEVDLIATVPNGTTTFTITTAFTAINTDKNTDNSSIKVADAMNLAVSTANVGDEIFPKVLAVRPSTASYHGYSKAEQEPSWVISETENLSSRKPLPLEANGSYKIPEDYRGKTIYIAAVWQNGAIPEGGDGSDLSAVTSKPVSIAIDKGYTSVTGINFAGVNNLTDVKGSTADGYTAEVQGSATEDVTINLSQAAVEPSDANAKDIDWSLSGTEPEMAKFDGNTNIVTVKQGNGAGTIALQITVADGLAEGSAYITTLTITIKAAPAAPEPPETTSLFTTRPPEENTDTTTTTPTENVTTPEVSNPTEGGDNTVVITPTEGEGENKTEGNESNTTVPPADDSNTEGTNPPTGGENTVTTTPEPEVTTPAGDENKKDEVIIVPVTDINFNIAGLAANTVTNNNVLTTTYSITSDSAKTLQLNDTTTTDVNGVVTRTGAIVQPENATNKEITWKVKEGTLIITDTTAKTVTVKDIGTLDQNTNTFTINQYASGTVTLVATILDGAGKDLNFTKELTITVIPPATNAINAASMNTIQTVAAPVTNSTNNTSNTTTNKNMPSNTTQATTRQVVSVGTTSVGTSSVSSASTSKASNNTNITSAARTTSSSDVKIEVSGRCKVNTNIPLKAVSKTTQVEYTDVSWEVVDDGGTGARIVNSNRLRASKTGTATIEATVYTSSGSSMVCSIDVTITR